MKTALAFLLLALSATAAGNPDKEVLAAVDASKQAALKGDAAALGKLCHDGLAYTNSTSPITPETRLICTRSWCG